MRIDKNTTIRLGNRNIVKIKIGDVVIWQKTTGPVVGPDYFYIESLGDGNTISVKNQGNGDTTNVTPTLEYSTDKNTWNTITFDWTNGNHTTELPVKLNTGGKMYFRNDTRKFSNSSSKYITFSSSVSSNVGGDIRTLSNYLDVNSETKPQTYMFYYLFNGNNKIVDASNLRLSYTTLANDCYNNMFGGCTSLTTAPELPATILAVSCYGGMFGGCTGLTTAPSLPASTLVSYCYSSMFSGCNKLTVAPELSATTLAKNCYSNMFRNCGLTTAPALPAKTLGHSCYSSMFFGCKSLTTAPALPATTLAPYCYSSMFSGCTSLTTAPALPATTLDDSCYGSMFNGCISLTTAPALPAKTLASKCYGSMFNGCISLTTAPALPATKLASKCYESMFNGCSNLNKVLTYADDISTSNFTTNWLNNVASSGTLYNAGSAVYTTDSPSGIPTGWTEDTTVPTTTSVYALPNTFSAKSWETMPKLNYFIIGVNETGIDVPLSEQNELITIGKNTGSSTVTHTETLTYDGINYTITINQTANDTDEPDYFYIESLGDGNTISVKNQENASYQTSHTPTLEYSTDKNTWNIITFDMTSGEHTTELPVKLNTGGKMYFRNDTGKFSGSYSNSISFSSTVSSNVGGDIRTLSNYLDVNNETKPQSYMFVSLFNNNKNIVDASNLRLSYNTLTTNCYSSMFSGCTSLTTAPELPATKLANSCYSSMFSDCEKLKSVTVYAKDISASNCTNNWLSGVASSGTFNNMGFASFETGASGIPSGWTENIPPIQSITANPNTFTIEFNNETVTCNSTLTITTTTGITNTRTNSATLTVGENTGDSTRTLTETIPYKGSSYDVTIVQSAIQSITANPDTFTIKSYKDTVKCNSTLTITTTLGTTATDTNTATITVGENTGDTTRTLTETIPYKGSSYQVTIVQTANDIKPVISWNVVSTGTYPFELNTNGYYESTNKGHDSSYSYATLNYSGFENLVLECINSGESNYDYGIISQPDVQLSESYEDDGATGSTKVFKNFKGESSTNPVQLTIPSDEGSHFITIKFRKDSSQAQGNDSLQFKVIEP